MSNELQIFNNPEFGDIRAMEIDHEPWFVGKDVAVALGYSNASKAVIEHVDAEDKRFEMLLVSDSQNGNLVKTAIINESGLYSLVLSSKLPGAKQFKRWVTSEVLPSIRKHGAYMTPVTIDSIIADPDFGIRLLTELKAEHEKRKTLEQTVGAQNQQIAEMQPKASYYDVVLNCTGLITTSVIAKDYGKSAIWLNKFLHEHGIQYNQSGTWLLYQKYAQMGYTSTKTRVYKNHGTEHVKVHTYWTQKGRLFLYDLLKSEGFLPVMEQPA